MRRLKELFSPLITFIAVQLVWLLLVILWIRWFIGRQVEFRRLAERYRPEVVPPGLDWPVLVGGLVLLVLVLAGLYIIFLYWQRQSNLYTEQKNFISQITHELKSPLASIQLHLETIRLRKPPPDKMERFLDTMLADTDRLNMLINNVLLAAKLEQSRKAGHYPAIDFSEFASRCLEQCRRSLPEGGALHLAIEPGIRAAIDADGMEMVLRNLWENALLYSSAEPEVRVSLRRQGKFCQLQFEDNGRGIDPREFRKIFLMFYRVRQSGETIRGTGLGLYIVKSVIRRHRGRISVSSGGNGKGSTFTITLPMEPQGR
jgi:signal transduction histidine kinase